MKYNVIQLKENIYKIIWLYNENIKITTQEEVVVIDITDDIEKIDMWCDILIDWVIQDSEIYINHLTNIKKQECRQLILARYSETDQQNIQTDAIATGNTVELEEMRAFITAMITEYQTNWKDSDFSNINP